MYWRRCWTTSAGRTSPRETPLRMRNPVATASRRLPQRQEAQLMLTNPRDAMLDTYIESTFRFRYIFFAIPEKFIARRELEVQRVTSSRLPRLGGLIALFSTYCHQNRIQTVCINENIHDCYYNAGFLVEFESNDRRSGLSYGGD